MLCLYLSAPLGFLPCQWWYWWDIGRCIWGHRMWNFQLWIQAAFHRRACGGQGVSKRLCWATSVHTYALRKNRIEGKITGSCLENACRPSWSMVLHQLLYTFLAHTLYWRSTGRVRQRRWQAQQQQQLSCSKYKSLDAIRTWGFVGIKLSKLVSYFKGQKTTLEHLESVFVGCWA